jgi:hypothetical protein
MFYIYDYEFSGEHRVRLVFNGAKQSPTTYTEASAPTVRAESVRLFHLFAVEYSYIQSASMTSLKLSCVLTLTVTYLSTPQREIVNSPVKY